MKWKKDLFIFITIYIVMVCVAISNFPLPDWDWFNYRFYNCWAFLTDRMTTDFFAGNFRTCFNPLIDIPEYLLLWKLNSHPYIFIFVGMIDSVLLLFLVYKIAEDFFLKDCILSKTTPTQSISTNNLSEKHIYSVAIIFSLLYVLLSPVMIQQMAFGVNDVKIAVFILLAFLVFKKNIFLESSKKRNSLIFLSGFIIGLATGFKLTACIYAISFVLIMLIFLKKINNPFKTIAIFCVGFIPAFLLVDGFWLYKVYKVYHNPFFPYFNNIFKSEFVAPIALLNSDTAHLKPQSVFEFIFYSFYQSGFGRLFGNDNYSWDIRYAINFVLVICCFVLAILIKYINKLKIYINNFLNMDTLILLSLFTFLPLYINIIIFGSYRYIIASSALYGIMLFSLITILCKISAKQKLFSIIFCFLFLIYAYSSQDYGDVWFVKDVENNKTSGYSKIYSIDDLKFKDNSAVILLNCATSAAVVKQNPNVQYIGAIMPNGLLKREEDFLKFFDPWLKCKTIQSTYIEKLISDIIASDKTIYAIITRDEHERYAKETILYLDKTNRRTLENCTHTNMRIYESFFYGVDIIKCEFNIKK